MSDQLDLEDDFKENSDPTDLAIRLESLEEQIRELDKKIDVLTKMTDKISLRLWHIEKKLDEQQ